MKQHHESINKKSASPSCYIMTWLPSLLCSPLKNVSRSVFVFFLYISQVISLSRPLSFLSTSLLALSKSWSCLTANRIWELSSYSSLIIPGSSATCLSLWREVRGRAKSSIASGEIRRGLIRDWQVFIYTFSPRLTILHFSSLLSFPGEQNALASPWKYVFCISDADG